MIHGQKKDKTPKNGSTSLQSDTMITSQDFPLYLFFFFWRSAQKPRFHDYAKLGPPGRRLTSSHKALSVIQVGENFLKY